MIFIEKLYLAVSGWKSTNQTNHIVIDGRRDPVFSVDFACAQKTRHRVGPLS